MNWTHDALGDDLAAHLRGMTDRRVWVNMQLGPSGSTRPDVYTIPCSFTRFTPLAYECKVSVSDFRADVTKGKYTDYLAYASGVMFACPAGLLKKEDMPKGAGLMVRGEEGWRTLKAPTLAQCPELPRKFWLKLLMDGERRDHEREAYLRDYAVRGLNEREVSAKIRAKFGEAVAAAIDDHHNQTTRRLDSLKYQITTQMAVLEGELKRIDERRREARKSADDQCSKLLTELAALVGMDPDPDKVYVMANRLRDMIALAQEGSTVKRMRELVRNMSYSFKEFGEMESTIQDAAQPSRVAA
ncbi:hypothetical protein [Cupriavidus sp. YAF13]|uniref:hypothetical protein n=1 Tax=Cupriavidus sp. YAF13 TaxID=3233075 RepID=UPI003F926883